MVALRKWGMVWRKMRREKTAKKKERKDRKDGKQRGSEKQKEDASFWNRKPTDRKEHLAAVPNEKV